MTALFAAAWCTFANPQAVGPPELGPEETERALTLTPIQRATIQRGLAVLGFDVGPLDGIFGRRTRAAIIGWQTSTGTAATGWLDANDAGFLLAAGTESAPAQETAKRLGGVDYGARIESVESLDGRRRATALLAICLEQAAVGDFRDALATAARIRDPYVGSHALNLVAKHQANAGDLRGAAQSVSIALAVARTVANEDRRVLALERTNEMRAAIRELGQRRGSRLSTPAGTSEGSDRAHRSGPPPLRDRAGSP